MKTKTAKRSSSPLIPTVAIQLDIDGKVRDFNLRFSLLSSQRIDEEAKQAGDELGNVRRTAIIVKHCLSPRDDKLSNDDIMDSFSFGSIEYLGGKIDELMALNGRGGATSTPIAGRKGPLKKTAHRKRGPR